MATAIKKKRTTARRGTRKKIRVAIIGVGNCASSLVQGVHYYRNAKPGDPIPGIMHVDLGGYHDRDVECGDELDVSDVIATEIDVHDPGDRVPGLRVPVVVHALHERARAVADTDDRDADPLLLGDASRC